MQQPPRSHAAATPSKTCATVQHKNRTRGRKEKGKTEQLSDPKCRLLHRLPTCIALRVLLQPVLLPLASILQLLPHL